MEENKIILEVPTKETLYFKKEIKEDPDYGKIEVTLIYSIVY